MRCPIRSTPARENTPRAAVKVGNTGSGIGAPKILRVALQAIMLDKSQLYPRWSLAAKKRINRDTLVTRASTLPANADIIVARNHLFFYHVKKKFKIKNNNKNDVSMVTCSFCCRHSYLTICSGGRTLSRTCHIVDSV